MGKLTPREFYNMIEGYNKRREKTREDMAVQAIMIGRVQNEKKMTVDKLLGREGKKMKQPKVISLEERKKESEYIDKAFGL